MISNKIVELLKSHLYGDYNDCKDILRYQAIRIDNLCSRRNLTYYDVAVFGEYFTEYGMKYGLLREFRENGIC